jgi:peptidoglycan/LPS O-acetylase OafA/YrhL
MAVFIFFVLSGFWITRMWREKYSRLKPAYVVFMMSRVWRLLPVFLVANVAAVCIHYWLYGPLVMSLRAIFSNLFILGFTDLAHSAPKEAVLGISWSLDIEIQFYLVAPLLIWLLGRIRPSIVPLAASIILMACLSAFFLGLVRITTVIPYLGFFLIGMIAAMRSLTPNHIAVILSTAVGILIVAVVLAAPELRHIIVGGRHPFSMFQYNWPLSGVLALLFSPYALATTKGRSSPIDHDLGDLSYIVYLIHIPLISIYGFYFGQLPAVERVPYLAVTFGAVGAISILLLRFVSQPMERLRRGFISRSQALEMPGMLQLDQGNPRK